MDRSAVWGLARRYGVIPVHLSGSLAKAPAVPNPADYRERVPTETELQSWFGNGQAYGLGLHAGQHGLVCIDFDDGSTYEPWLELVNEHDPDLAGQLCHVRTKAGYHVWYRCSAAPHPTRSIAEFATKQLLPGRRKATTTRIETRGVGAYAIVPPTPGYTLLRGDLLNLPDLTPDEQDLLLGLASTFDEREPAETPAKKKSAGEAIPGDRPGDWFNERADLAQLVTEAGGHSPRKVGHRTYWCRPGKMSGVSLSIGNGARHDLVKVHTSNWPPFDMGECLSAFGFYAKLHHGGDFAAAAKAISARSDFPKPPQQREAPIGPDGDMDPDLDEGPEWDLNDVGNAARFVHQHGADLRYCGEWGRWLTWNGVCWSEDGPDNPCARAKARETVQAMRSRRRTASWGLKCGNTGRLTNMLREAQGFAGIQVAPTDLDTDPWLLAASNGVIDLRTGDFVSEERSRAALITQRVNAPYDKAATCPMFEQFLVDIMQDRLDLIDLLVQALGYSLTGSTQEQKFFMLYGPRGRNGKSTLMLIMQELLGTGLCGTIRKNLLTHPNDDGNKFAKAMLEGKRLVFANETSNRAKLDVEFLKEFIAGDPMEVERKGRDQYQINITAKFWYSVNSLPSAEFDNSFKNRLITIPFDQSFYEETDSEYQAGDRMPNRQLLEHLRAELPGILALLVGGCRRWLDSGRLPIPAAVKALQTSYADENDSVKYWIDERCTLGPECRQRSTELYADYRDFCKAQGFAPLRTQEFPRRLAVFPGVSKILPRNVSWFTGIRVVPAGGQETLENFE